MTGLYERNPMPHRVDIKCPRCRRHAEFEFVEVCTIHRVSDVDTFKRDPRFEYRRLQDRCGHYWHAALYYAGLHGEPERALENLPQAYTPSNWRHSKFNDRGYVFDGDLGSVSCSHCHLRRTHNLDWPAEAYFSIAYRNHVLWAFNRESAWDLHDFIASTTRYPGKYRWRLFLLHVPTVFKTQKARSVVTRQLRRLLGDEGRRSRR